MKQSYFHTSPEGPIGLIEGDKMPVDYGQNCYQSELEAAKASAIPVQDRERALRLIKDFVKIMYNAERIKDEAIIIPDDQIYGPFNIRYEIKKEWRQDKTNEYVPYTVKVAILYDDTPEKEESWVDDPVFSIMEIARMESIPSVKRYQLIKEKFTITRK